VTAKRGTKLNTPSVPRIKKIKMLVATKGRPWRILSINIGFPPVEAGDEYYQQASRGPARKRATSHQGICASYYPLNLMPSNIAVTLAADQSGPIIHFGNFSGAEILRKKKVAINQKLSSPQRDADPEGWNAQPQTSATPARDGPMILPIGKMVENRPDILLPSFRELFSYYRCCSRQEPTGSKLPGQNGKISIKAPTWAPGR